MLPFEDNRGSRNADQAFGLRARWSGCWRFLAFDTNVIVTQVARDEVEVSFLGSLNTYAQVMQSELRLRLWLAAHPDVIATMQE